MQNYLPHAKALGNYSYMYMRLHIICTGKTVNMYEIVWMEVLYCILLRTMLIIITADLVERACG